MDKVTVEDANLPAPNAETWQCRRFLWARLAPLYRLVSDEEMLESSSATSATYDLVGLSVAVRKFRRDGEALRHYSTEDYIAVFGHDDGKYLHNTVQKLQREETFRSLKDAFSSNLKSAEVPLDPANARRIGAVVINFVFLLVTALYFLAKAMLRGFA
ncbi:hypothetical protein MMC22_009263 [Lobaria immixta]|nr:hypothetical protein [Lobaria immixta]